MKKIAALVLLTALLLALPVFASEKTTFYGLFQKWEKEGYPDYVCGVWLTYGGAEKSGTLPELDSACFNVSLLPGKEGERGREEILSLVSDGAQIRFLEGKYSRNELVRLQDTIMKRFAAEFPRGCASSGVVEPGNYIEVNLYRGKTPVTDLETSSGLTADHYEEIKDGISVEKVEERVKALEAFGKKLEAEYGEKVRVTLYDGRIELLFSDYATHVALFPDEQVYALSARPPYWLLLLPLVLLVAVLLFLTVRRRAVLLPAEGTAEHSRASVEAQAASLLVSPSEETDARILDEIMKK